MPEQKRKSRQEFEADLVERAAKDDAFRQALIDDPKGTLQRELGTPLPDAASVTVLEETPTGVYLVLPPRPAERRP